MYSVMTIVNTAVLYTWKMLRKSFESSHYTLRIYNCGVIGVLINFTVFVLQYIHLLDITPYTLNLHEVYAYHISIKLEKKKKKQLMIAVDVVITVIRFHFFCCHNGGEIFGQIQGPSILLFSLPLNSCEIFNSPGMFSCSINRYNLAYSIPDS